MTKKIKKVVLAYSGGLDTSAMLLWIKETYGCEVVCYCADVGQGDELTGLEEKAKATGASTLYVASRDSKAPDRDRTARRR
jgi:argininosuccinate synthase